MPTPTDSVQDPTDGSPVDLHRADCHLQVLCRRRTALTRWRVPIPRRPFWRLYWNPTPGAWVERGHRRWPLTADRFLLIAPGTPFRVGLERPVEHGYAHLLLGRPIDDLGPLVITHPVDATVRQLLETLFVPGAVGAQPRHLPPLLAVLGLALAALAPSTWPRPPSDPAVAAMCRLLERDPARPWRNAELAAAVDLAATTANRRFRRATGTSPQAWLLQRRLERARILLEHEHDPIEAVAERCGFSTRSHFTTVFTREVGESPAAYRRQARAGHGSRP